MLSFRTVVIGHQLKDCEWRVASGECWHRCFSVPGGAVGMDTALILRRRPSTADHPVHATNGNSIGAAGWSPTATVAPGSLWGRLMTADGSGRPSVGLSACAGDDADPRGRLP